MLDGRSLLDLLEDPGAEWGRDILIENGNGANGVPAYHGLRTYRFLYVEHRTTGEYELYDLLEDPFQLQSRDGQDRYRAVQRELRQRLRTLDRCSGATCSPPPGTPALRALEGPAGRELRAHRPAGEGGRLRA